MNRFLVAMVFMAFAGAANAQCVGGPNGTVQTNAYLLTNEFQDGRPAASITPACVRDLIASLAPQTGKFVGLPTSPTGLVSGQMWLNGTVLSVVTP